MTDFYYRYRHLFEDTHVLFYLITKNTIQNIKSYKYFSFLLTFYFFFIPGHRFSTSVTEFS